MVSLSYTCFFLSSGLCKISDASVVSVAQKCKLHVEHLNLYLCSKITDKSVIAIGKNCLNIQYLNLFYCKLLRDEGITALAHKCAKLRFLNLSACAKITDRSVEALAVGCSALEVLNLSKCLKVTNASVALLVRSCLKLRDLQLHGCNRLDDTVLVEIGKNLPLLEALDVAGCPKITDMGIDAISHGCTSMTYLNISSPWNNITRGAIIHVAERCPRLHSLAMSQVSSVDHEMLQQICTTHKGLQHITISKCKQLSAENIQQLRLKFAGLSFYI